MNIPYQNWLNAAIALFADNATVLLQQQEYLAFEPAGSLK